VNIVPAYLPYEEAAVREAKVVKVEGIRTKILTPEYLIATKLHRSIFRYKNDGDISDLFKYQKISMRKLENILSEGFKGQKRIDALERFFPDGLRVIRKYSPRDFTRLWKEQAKANERRRLMDIRLPFSKKLEIMDFFLRMAGSRRRYKRARETSRRAA